MKHALMMVIGFGIPLLLTFLLPVFGVTSSVTFSSFKPMTPFIEMAATFMTPRSTALRWPADQLKTDDRIVFTFLWQEGWEGKDFQVEIAAANQPKKTR